MHFNTLKEDSIRLEFRGNNRPITRAAIWVEFHTMVVFRFHPNLHGRIPPRGWDAMPLAVRNETCL
jgi:hypothetical protein